MCAWITPSTAFGDNISGGQSSNESQPDGPVPAAPSTDNQTLSQYEAQRDRLERLNQHGAGKKSRKLEAEIAGLDRKIAAERARLGLAPKEPESAPPHAGESKQLMAYEARRDRLERMKQAGHDRKHDRKIDVEIAALDKAISRERARLGLPPENAAPGDDSVKKSKRGLVERSAAPAEPPKGAANTSAGKPNAAKRNGRILSSPEMLGADRYPTVGGRTNSSFISSKPGGSSAPGAVQGPGPRSAGETSAKNLPGPGAGDMAAAPVRGSAALDRLTGDGMLPSRLHAGPGSTVSGHNTPGQLTKTSNAPTVGGAGPRISPSRPATGGSDNVINYGGSGISRSAPTFRQPH